MHGSRPKECTRAFFDLRSGWVFSAKGNTGASNKDRCQGLTAATHFLADFRCVSMLTDLSLKNILRSLFHTVCNCSSEKGLSKAPFARQHSRARRVERRAIRR